MPKLYRNYHISKLYIKETNGKKIMATFTIDDISSSVRFNIELMSETLIPNTLLNAFATTLLSSVFYDISLRYPTMDSNSLFTEDLSSPLCRSSA